MSAFVLSKEGIDKLTVATAAMLQLNNKYRLSYPLAPATVDLIGKYRDDLHNLYRALFIANIKAVNGRYGEDQKTLPKYTPLHAWDVERLAPDMLKEAAEIYSTYLYQCSEDPVIDTPIYNALYDVYKLLCLVLVKYTMIYQ